MRWDEIVQAAVAMLQSDAQLDTALGATPGTEYIFPASAARAARIPSIEYFMVLDRYEESLNVIVVQFDYWARGMAQAAAIESRLRRLLHSDVRRTFAGVDCATLYEDSRDHDHPDPGVVHRSLDFRFEPVRER